MKCAKYILIGAVAVPLFCFWLAIVLAVPAGAAKYLGFDPIWGLPFSLTILGACGGWLHCWSTRP